MKVLGSWPAVDTVAKKWLIYIVIASSPKINTVWDWMIKLSLFVGFILVAAAPIILTTADQRIKATHSKFVQVEILLLLLLLVIYFLPAMFIQWHFNSLGKKKWLITYVNEIRNLRSKRRLPGLLECLCVDSWWQWRPRLYLNCSRVLSLSLPPPPTSYPHPAVAFKSFWRRIRKLATGFCPGMVF